MQKHFMTTSDGALWDMRDRPLGSLVRRNYSFTHAEIKTVADYKATVRNGPFAWPGGYPMYFVCSDGAALCFVCARKEVRNIVDDIRDDMRGNGRHRYGWRVVACNINYEDSELTCDHCNKNIDPAYGDH